MPDSINYLDWILYAKKDLRGAEILYEHDCGNDITCFHIQQCVEKYLKAYLIYKEGVLQQGHSLLYLCKKASEYNSEYKKFLKDCALVNNYYIETRYPQDCSINVTNEEVEECFSIVKELIKFIDEQIEKE